METDGEPEVPLSGQDIYPIVLDPALTRPKITLQVPGDPWVPLDPDESSSENLLPRVWSASWFFLINRVYKRIGEISQCTSVLKYVKHR